MHIVKILIGIFQKGLLRISQFKIVLNTHVYIYFLMPKASTLGLVDESEYSPMEIGQTLEINGVHEILPVSEKRKWETAIVPTIKGKMSTTSKTVLGQLKSDKEKGLGKLIVAALAQKSTLTVYVVKNVNPENDNVGYKLSIFEPRN